MTAEKIPPAPGAPIQPWLASPARPADDSADERLTRAGASDVRGDESVREDAERRDSNLMTDDDVEQMLRDEFENTLSTPPQLEGYHLCWLTTTSQYDTIARRQRVGYTPVRMSEMPSYDPSNGQKLEQYEGFVTANEMVLCKIPMQRYQVMMNLFHHKNPLESEQAIVSKIKAMNDEAEGQSGRELEQGDGLSTLERSVKRGARLPTQRFS